MPFVCEKDKTRALELKVVGAVWNWTFDCLKVAMVCDEYMADRKSLGFEYVSDFCFEIKVKSIWFNDASHTFLKITHRLNTDSL